MLAWTNAAVQVTKGHYLFVSASQKFFVGLKSLFLDVVVHSIVVINRAVLFQGFVHLQTRLYKERKNREMY